MDVRLVLVDVFVTLFLPFHSTTVHSTYPIHTRYLGTNIHPSRNHAWAASQHDKGIAFY
jgi:hypothetical protein